MRRRNAAATMARTRGATTALDARSGRSPPPHGAVGRGGGDLHCAEGCDRCFRTSAAHRKLVSRRVCQWMPCVHSFEQPGYLAHKTGGPPRVHSPPRRCSHTFLQLQTTLYCATQARIHRTAAYAVARKVLTQHHTLINVWIASACTVAVVSLQRLADIPAPDEWRSCFRSCFLLIKLDDINAADAVPTRPFSSSLLAMGTFNYQLRAGAGRRRRRRWAWANLASSPTAAWVIGTKHPSTPCRPCKKRVVHPAEGRRSAAAAGWPEAFYGLQVLPRVHAMM